MKKYVDHALNSPSALEFMKALRTFYMGVMFQLKIILSDL